MNVKKRIAKVEERIGGPNQLPEHERIWYIEYDYDLPEAERKQLIEARTSEILELLAAKYGRFDTGQLLIYSMAEVNKPAGAGE